MMAVLITLGGEVVSRSKNLRGICTYAHSRRTRVVEYLVTEIGKGRGQLFVRWENGAEATTEFADYTVAVWFVNHRRSWPK